MRRSLILGRSNVGKTLFLINFSRYLNLKTLKILSDLPNGGRLSKEYTLQEAINELVSEEPHATLYLQSILLDIPAGKGRKTLEIVDTTGLCEGIHGSKQVRMGMAQTITQIQTSEVILHMVDASKTNKRGSLEAPSLIDDEIYRFAGSRGMPYVILANKMDLPGANEGLLLLKKRFDKNLIIPISAMRGWGFKEVKRFLLRSI